MACLGMCPIQCTGAIPSNANGGKDQTAAEHVKSNARTSGHSRIVFLIWKDMNERSSRAISTSNRLSLVNRPRGEMNRSRASKVVYLDMMTTTFSSNTLRASTLIFRLTRSREPLKARLVIMFVNRVSAARWWPITLRGQRSAWKVHLSSPVSSPKE